MVEPYIGEIRMFGFNFPPRDWAFCDGAVLAIDQNQSLFSILGVHFGGDGRTNFQLPDLRGRTPVQVGTGFPLGDSDGEETHVLTTNEIPSHTHTLQATNQNATLDAAGGNVLANTTPVALNAYHNNPSSMQPMGDETVGQNSGGQGRENMQPFLVVNFCIAMTGTFPPRN